MKGRTNKEKNARRVKRAEREKRRRREREKEMGMRYARSVKRAER